MILRTDPLMAAVPEALPPGGCHQHAAVLPF